MGELTLQVKLGKLVKSKSGFKNVEEIEENCFINNIIDIQ